MKYITEGFSCWKYTLIDGFKEVYERHEVNLATIFELLAYVFIELLVAPLHAIDVIVRGSTWAIEDNLGKPKIVKVESKKEKAL